MAIREDGTIMGDEGNSGAITAASLKELEDRVNAAAANMLTSRLGTFEKKLLEKINTGSAEMFQKVLDDKLKDFKPGEAGGGEGGKGSKKDVEIETLRKQVEELRRSNEETASIAAQERAKNKRVALNQNVTDTLASLARIEGVPARMALAALTANGRVFYDEEGDNPDRIVFKGDDGLTVDLGMGLKAWLKTDEGKFFLPQTTVRGSGSRPGGAAPGAGGNGPMTNDQRLAHLQTLLDDSLT